MARKPAALVLDSWAILAYLEDDDSGQKVADLIADSHETGVPLAMSVVNVGEIWHIIAREISEPEANRTVTSLREIGIEFVEADWPLAQLAASFKAKHRMSYADCFAVALTMDRKAELVTGDSEFRQVDSNIRIRWLGA